MMLAIGQYIINLDHVMAITANEDCVRFVMAHSWHAGEGHAVRQMIDFHGDEALRAWYWLTTQSVCLGAGPAEQSKKKSRRRSARKEPA